MGNESTRPQVLEVIRSRLVDLGFDATTPEILTCVLAEGVDGLIALHCGVSDHRGTVKLYPFIGVRHKSIEKLYDLLLSEPRDALSATAGRLLTDLIPHREEHGWLLNPPGDARATVTEIVGAVDRLGRPFMQRLLDLRFMADVLRGEFGERSWRLPPVLLVAGDRQAAEEFVRNELQQLNHQRPAYQAFYREYARRFSLIADAYEQRLEMPTNADVEALESQRSGSAIAGPPTADDATTRSTKLEATFKVEDTTPDGEDIGPLIVWDPDEQVVLWESADWIRRSEALKLAKEKGWKFGVD